MKTFYIVTKEWDDKRPKVRSIQVHETPALYIFFKGDRSAFGYRTRWRKDGADFAETRESAIARYVAQQKEAIVIAKQDIEDAEANLKAVERGL